MDLLFSFAVIFLETSNYGCSSLFDFSFPRIQQAIPSVITSPLHGKIWGLASAIAGNEINTAGPIVCFALKLFRNNKIREKK